VLMCTSCTETDGGQNPNPSLPLPCSESIANDNGALECSEGAGDAGSGGVDGGSLSDQDGSIGEEDASSGLGDAGSGVDATDGGGVSNPSSGCSCSLSALRTASPVQSAGLLAIAALIRFGRRRKRGV